MRNPNFCAEVDGNRTRRMGIAHPTRFEGGGAHQALGHLHHQPYKPQGEDGNGGVTAPLQTGRSSLAPLSQEG